MAVKKNTIKLARENLSLSLLLRSYVSYADHYAHRDIFSSFVLQNTGTEAIGGVTVVLSDDKGLLLPFRKEIAEIPYESRVEIGAEGILSPLYLARLEAPEAVTVFVTVSVGKTTVAETSATVTALPFSYAEGIGGNLCGLAGFVRPRLADCQMILKDAVQQVKKWGGSIGELGSYAGLSRSDARLLAAGIYVAVKKYHIERVPQKTRIPFSVGDNTALLSKGEATAVELAVFFASCAEAAGLHPVMLVGEDAAAAGVWLYEGCFVDSVTEDMSMVLRRTAEGASDISIFDTEDLYDGKNISYTTSQKHAEKKLSLGEYEALIDVRRARMSQVHPLPLKAKGRDGAVLSEEELFDAAPAALPMRESLALSGVPKNKQWERRLLDLSLKNTLLAFRHQRNAVRLFVPDAEVLVKELPLLSEAEISVYPENSEQYETCLAFPPYAEAGKYAAYREIFKIELRNGILRAAHTAESATEELRALLRRNRAAEEEFGVSAVYLAIGFLHWQETEGGESLHAPLVLLPVRLTRLKAGRGFSLSASEDACEVNTTLLEFLKGQFGIDIRGLDRLASAMPIQEIFSAVKAAVARMKGWSVTEDVYLSSFSFARYAMWNDIRQNFDIYKKNRLVKSLVEGKNLLPAPEIDSRGEDGIPPHEILTPLAADGSQFEALKAARSGASFVLHGPPGTGKSQTITNIIANALYEGKRVLFVAEKAAALSVVEKRLHAIGLGDFCLALHSAKADKSDVTKKIEETLLLREKQTEGETLPTDESLYALRNALREPMEALHRKRRLGASVYEAILLCLRYKNAPELVEIEHSFYDTLTKDNLSHYEQLISVAAAAARECGGVSHTPFDEIGLTDCGGDTRERVRAAAEGLLAEVKNLRSYLSLVLRIFRQKIGTVTEERLSTLSFLVDILIGKGLSPYFAATEGELVRFYAANLRLDRALSEYNLRYKAIADISKEYAAIETEIDNWGNNYRSSAVLSSILKKLRKVSRAPLSAENELHDIELIASIHIAMREVAECKTLAKSFSDRSGNLNHKKRAEFLARLYDFHERAASVFLDYNAESMNEAIYAIRTGYADMLLASLKRAVETLRAAEAHYRDTVKAEPRRHMQDDICTYYTDKLGALLDNMDMLPNFCAYKASLAELSERGLSFIGDAMASGRLNADNLLESFLRNVYRSFLEMTIPADPVLSRFSQAVLEDTAERFRLMQDAYDKCAGELIRRQLIAKLPTMTTEGPMSIELLAFQRMSKQLRGVTLRQLLDKIPELFRTAMPCLLMSPVTVSQYLPADAELFDLVVFDEASQLPTCEAVPSLARARAAIVVGDNNQLPPTTFFNNSFADEEDLENEDMESVLDEWLTLGLPERHLTWHYRSKHESLIAFSNAMYYGNRLSTFPSPDAMESKVRVCFVEDGVYDRGRTKTNRREAEALINEVVRRLSDPVLSSASIGIVTFSTAQQEYIERKLTEELLRLGLDTVAYEREEPLFVKNLENVQGDERDVILFSIGYGPDQNGRLALNFGPLNQLGGWRRLNVAVSRAREEMLIFASMTSAMIDPSRTSSKGVLGLKAFLAFAEKGRNTLSLRDGDLKINKSDIGRYIADELRLYGYECRYNVGVSDFKIDVAVVDPKNKHSFILAILCDGNPSYPTRDTWVLQVQTLKRNNWNVVRVFTMSFFNNPKREAKRIKELLDKIVAPEGKRTRGDAMARYRKPYRAARLTEGEEAPAFVLSGEHNTEIAARLRAIVTAEEPISRDFLIRRCLSSFGIKRTGTRLDSAMDAILRLTELKSVELLGEHYYFRNEKALSFDRFRVEKDGEPLRRNETDFTPYEVIAVIRGLLESKVSVPLDEAIAAVTREMRILRPSDKMLKYIDDCITYAERNAMLLRSISDRISLC